MLPFITELYSDISLRTQLWLFAALTTYTYVLSLITGNFSQVDRLWSLIPTFYGVSIIYDEYSKYGSEQTPTMVRLVLMVALMGLWSIRLTFNYWRKGGYTVGSEDYRWEVVRKWFDYPKKKFLWHVFNLSFIALYQNWLLLQMALPLWFVRVYNRNEPVNYADVAVVLAFLAFLLIEIIADEQQWNFQSKKHKWLKSKKMEKNSEFTEQDFKRGFFTKGLFRYSRHPNFFAEMSLWWIIYLITLSSQLSTLLNNFDYNLLFNKTIYGTFLLTLLFQGSTWLTESISVAKYKTYKEYQKKVSRIIPCLCFAVTEVFLRFCKK